MSIPNDQKGLRAKQEKGFSLIELVLAIGLLSIMAFFLAFISIFNFQTFNSQTTELTISGDARTALDDIDNYTRQANRVLSSYSTYSSGSQTLVERIPSINTSGQIISNTYDTIVFYLSGSDLYRQIFPNQASNRSAVTKKLASHIDPNNFSFSYDNADYSLVKKVTTTITITQTAGTQTKSITLSSESILRNF